MEDLDEDVVRERLGLSLSEFLAQSNTLTSKTEVRIIEQLALVEAKAKEDLALVEAKAKEDLALAEEKKKEVLEYMALNERGGELFKRGF